MNLRETSDVVCERANQVRGKVSAMTVFVVADTMKRSMMIREDLMKLVPTDVHVTPVSPHGEWKRSVRGHTAIACINVSDRKPSAEMDMAITRALLTTSELTGAFISDLILVHKD